MLPYLEDPSPVVASAQLFSAGTGLYTVREAALYARLHPTVLNRWLFGNKRVLHPQIGSAGEKVVTFLDFVQALAVRAIRTQHKIALDKVRLAIEVAEKEFQVSFPLARRHTIYLLDRDIQIVPELDGDQNISKPGFGNKGKAMSDWCSPAFPA